MQIDLPRAQPADVNHQRERVHIGQRAEALVREALKLTNPTMIHKMIAGGDGTPFDYLVTYADGLHLGVEVKHARGYRLSQGMFTPAERDGLEAFEGGTNRALVAFVISSPGRQQALYMVPWRAIPKSGPIDPSQHEWIPRCGGQLDMRGYIESIRGGDHHKNGRRGGNRRKRSDARDTGVGGKQPDVRKPKL